jgi:hypothetical protein
MTAVGRDGHADEGRRHLGPDLVMAHRLAQKPPQRPSHGQRIRRQTSTQGGLICRLRHPYLPWPGVNDHTSPLPLTAPSSSLNSGSCRPYRILACSR